MFSITAVTNHRPVREAAEGSAAGVLRLQPPFAGVDAIYRFVNASSSHRSRPITRSFGANVVYINIISRAIHV